jgi:hypothetical protein
MLALRTARDVSRHGHRRTDAAEHVAHAPSRLAASALGAWHETIARTAGSLERNAINNCRRARTGPRSTTLPRAPKPAGRPAGIQARRCGARLLAATQTQAAGAHPTTAADGSLDRRTCTPCQTPARQLRHIYPDLVRPHCSIVVGP